VVDRRLEDPRTTFEVGDRVWFWTRVLGGTPEEPIRHVWLHEGAVINSIELILGGSHWRAYSWQTMRPGAGGRWSVEARDAKGRLLARETFVCTLP
jgi:hypothetical protein